MNGGHNCYGGTTKGNGSARCWLPAARDRTRSLHSKRALERLARHNGESQVALLERLFLEEQKRVTAGMDANQHRAYIGEPVTA